MGCGYWGSKHLRVFNELPGAELAALCEPSADTLAKQPRAFLPQTITGDYERFLSLPIDGVVIATPARTHFELASKALAAGKHVLVEKPFATNSRDAAQLVAEAERRGLTIAVGHTYVYHPAVEFLRKLIESGRLGRINYINTARLNFGLLQPDVDVLWDLAPHDLSILLQVLRQEPLVASARGAACVNPSLCEVAHLDLQFPGGPFAHIYVSWLEPKKVRRLTFIGDEATVVYDDIAQGETIRIYNQSIKMEPKNGSESALTPAYHQSDVTVPFLETWEPLRKECGDFAEAIRSGTPMTSPGANGLRVVRILEAAERSLHNGGAAEMISTPSWLDDEAEERPRAGALRWSVTR